MYKKRNEFLKSSPMLFIFQNWKSDYENLRVKLALVIVILVFDKIKHPGTQILVNVQTLMTICDVLHDLLPFVQ